MTNLLNRLYGGAKSEELLRDLANRLVRAEHDCNDLEVERIALCEIDYDTATWRYVALYLAETFSTVLYDAFGDPDGDDFHHTDPLVKAVLQRLVTPPEREPDEF